ncbi:MAG: metallophosphoesterase [Muribaculaceae bacterium]|nr:metallophosphoesterase [Muribaculaceae bacterium]
MTLLKKCLTLAVIAIAATATAQDKPFRFECKPYLQNVTDTSAIVVWATNLPAVSWVELAPDDSLHFYAEERPKFFDSLFGRKKTGCIHRVTLTGLKPDTKYRYRIYSREVFDNGERRVRYGNVRASDVYHGKPYEFRTTGAREDAVHFAIVNDIHENADRYNRLFHQVDSASLNFMILNGDMVNNMDTMPQLYNGFLNVSSDMFARSIPFYMVRGNHETRGKVQHNFIEQFPSSTGQPYYTFSRGPIFFIALDGGEDKPDSDIEYCDLADFDNYRTRQAEWLKSVVTSDEFLKAPYRVVLIHVPPVGITWHGLAEVQNKFLPILNNAGIDLMLSGHLHRPGYVAPGEQGLNFPLIINSNMEILDVHADDNAMDIKVIDQAGHTNRKFSVKPKRH